MVVKVFIPKTGALKGKVPVSKAIAVRSNRKKGYVIHSKDIARVAKPVHLNLFYKPVHVLKQLKATCLMHPVRLHAGLQGSERPAVIFKWSDAIYMDTVLNVSGFDEAERAVVNTYNLQEPKGEWGYAQSRDLTSYRADEEVEYARGLTKGSKPVRIHYPLVDARDKKGLPVEIKHGSQRVPIIPWNEKLNEWDKKKKIVYNDDLFKLPTTGPQFDLLYKKNGYFLFVTKDLRITDTQMFMEGSVFKVSVNDFLSFDRQD